MRQIALRDVPRQSFSIVLDDSLYSIAIKECSGIMAATIIRDGITLISNRRIPAGMFVIPFPYLESGNFAFVTDNDELPYYTNFLTTNIFVYFSPEEVISIRSRIDGQ